MLYCCSVLEAMPSSCGCAQVTAPCRQHSRGSQRSAKMFWLYGLSSAAA